MIDFYTDLARTAYCAAAYAWTWITVIGVAFLRVGSYGAAVVYVVWAAATRAFR